jgi:hypothetical protein
VRCSDSATSELGGSHGQDTTQRTKAPPATGDSVQMALQCAARIVLRGAGSLGAARVYRQAAKSLQPDSSSLSLEGLARLSMRYCHTWRM